MKKDDPLISSSDTSECIIQSDSEEENAIVNIIAMKLHCFKNTLFWIIVILTGGIFYLLCYWFPSIRIKFSYSPCIVESCTHVYVKSEHFKSFTPVSKIYSKSRGELIVFHYQELMYYYDSERFQPLSFNYQLPNKVIIDTYCNGYSTEEDIKEMRVLFGLCQIYVPVIPLCKMIITEVFNPFYVFQVYSVILWYFEEYYYYSIAIVVITIISLISSITTTRRGLLALHNLAKKECEITVLRNSNLIKISSVNLVPGDLVHINPQMDIPCDFCLISGSCIVQEGMLTGESVPVLKDSLNYLKEILYNPDIDKRHTLYEGTKVIQTRNHSGKPVQAIVIRTGFTTVKGRLIRSIMYPKPNKFKFYEDSLKFIVFLLVLAIIGFCICIPRMIYLEYDHVTILLRVLDLITITVPPALPACMAAGTAFSISRLRNMRIYCISTNRVNVAGRIDMIVFDKTGTLTEDGMDLLGIQGNNRGIMEDLKTETNDINEVFKECMATCHSLAVINNELIGDTQDLQIFKKSGWVYEEQESKDDDFTIKAIVRPAGGCGTQDVYQGANDLPYELGILHIFHFSSKLKRMGVVVKNLQKNVICYYSKGAPEVIIEKCRNVPENINIILSKYTKKGYRVLACAYSILENFDVDIIKSTKIEDFENDLLFIGLIILQNKLKPQTVPSLQKLTDANIKTVMATGDAVLTGISVGRECGLIHPETPIFLGEVENNEIVWEIFEADDSSHLNKLKRAPWIDYTFAQNYALALTGAAFSKILKMAETESHEEQKALQLCLEKCKIYARMSPEHKTILVEKLQTRGFYVAMCGDGANDCGALKTADVGVSLSEADSSIAAPFTSQKADISSLLTVLKEGRCALTTSIQCFKYMALYSMIQFTSASFLYWFLGNLTNNQFLIFDLITVMPLAVFMSMAKPCEDLSRDQPPSELISLRVLLSVTLQAFLQIGFQIGAYIAALIVFHPFPDIQPGDNPGFFTIEDSVIYYMSWYEYQIICLAFSIGKPWKKPFYTNFYLVFYQIIMICLTTYTLFFQNSTVRMLINVMNILD